MLEIEKCACELLRSSFNRIPTSSATLQKGLAQFLRGECSDNDIWALDPDGDGPLGQEWRGAKAEWPTNTMGLGGWIDEDKARLAQDRACFDLLVAIVNHRANEKRDEFPADAEWGGCGTIREGHEWTTGLGGGLTVTTSLAAAVVQYHCAQIDAVYRLGAS